MTNKSQNPTLRVGDSVFVPVHNFIKESHDYKRGDAFMHAFYGSTGTVVKTHMVEEGIPNYALVHFDSIGGEQMLMRSEMVNQGEGLWSIRKR